ncbi:hypothetical protein BC567DRAFT_101260 [Phyllosticta citribraziliensis]
MGLLVVCVNPEAEADACWTLFYPDGPDDFLAFSSHRFIFNNIFCSVTVLFIFTPSSARHSSSIPSTNLPAFPYTRSIKNITITTTTTKKSAPQSSPLASPRLLSPHWDGVTAVPRPVSFSTQAHPSRLVCPALRLLSALFGPLRRLGWPSSRCRRDAEQSGVTPLFSRWEERRRGRGHRLACRRLLVVELGIESLMAVLGKEELHPVRMAKRMTLLPTWSVEKRQCKGKIS